MRARLEFSQVPAAGDRDHLSSSFEIGVSDGDPATDLSVAAWPTQNPGILVLYYVVYEDIGGEDSINQTPTTLSVYWASSHQASSILGGPAMTVPVATETGTHDFLLSVSDLGPRPPAAEYLIFVIDPEDLVREPDESNNTDYWRLSPLEPKVYSVAFSGDGFSPVAPDPTPEGGSGYSLRPIDAQHWLDQDFDGANDLSQRNVPISYVVGSSYRIDVSIDLRGQRAADEMYIRGLRKDGTEAVPATIAVLDEHGRVAAGVTAAMAFPDTIIVDDDFEHRWQLSLDGKQTWIDVGSTTQQLYTTRVKPSQLVVFHSVIDISSRSAQGESGEEESFTKIWEEFEDRMVYRVGSETPMTYYGDWEAAGSDFRQLLAHGDGQCGAWAGLLVNTMMVNGVWNDSSQVKVLVPDVRIPSDIYTPTLRNSVYDVFLVKEWRQDDRYFTPQWHVNLLGSPIVNHGKYNFGHTELHDEVGIAGQGPKKNNDPRSIFDRHIVVERNGIIYDPSYGEEFPGGMQQWATESLYGMGELIHRQITLRESALENDWNRDSDKDDVQVAANGALFSRALSEISADGNQQLVLGHRWPESFYDGTKDAQDINDLAEAIRGGLQSLGFDLNQDGHVDFGDLAELISNIYRTTFGDSDLDGVFDSSDFVQVFRRGEYEDEVSNNSGWEDGDWNGDGDFDSSDIVMAFQTGLYEVLPQANARQIAAAVDWLFAQDQRSARQRAYVA